MSYIHLVDQAISAALAAGIRIREVYSLSDFNIQLKEDQTPVTYADRQAHDEILKKLEPAGLPVLSEEGIHLNYNERKSWNLFWLVDPLDGTKEFIKRNDEFTVNIALVEQGSPVAGVIYAPVTDVLYVGIVGQGAYKRINPEMDCTFHQLRNSGINLPEQSGPKVFTVLVSRSHMNAETQKYIDRLASEQPSFEVVAKGSSLKMCMIAEGSASIYPKLGTTMEWDTAAGHAILKASGKNMYHRDLKTELTYNKENLQNPHFIAL
jgi:3'(2'), 5'-bisphosphate nucleotidase